MSEKAEGMNNELTPEDVFDYEKFTKESILQPYVFEKMYSIEDSFVRTRVKFRLLNRAKELGVKTDFSDMIRDYNKEYTKKWREEKLSKLNENVTNFLPDINGKEYENLFCAGWNAGEDGVYTYESSQVKQTVCYHPILPIKRLKNIQTGDELLVIAFKRNGIWQEKTVSKLEVASAGKIVGLATCGVSVTSETAKLLVRFLADLENWNEDKISVQKSTTKLGWFGNDFIPFDPSIIFEDNDYKYLSDSITEYGDFSVWREHIMELRRTKNVELRLAIASSFCSVIIPFLGIMPFIVDFYGTTEFGKTVLLMVAASIWGNPRVGEYIGDFQTSPSALEARLDVLNHLPVFLDDSSKADSRIRESFETVIYNICSGKGKSRSNVKLGTERDRTWKNVVICNGERNLSSYAFQGGAINRIVEVSCRNVIFSNPAYTAELVKNNFGFAGRMFVGILKKMDPEEIKKIHQKYKEELTTSESMQKQVIAIAAILTADEIATKNIFNDDFQLTCDDVSRFLTNKNEISDGRRCYDYLLDIIDEQGHHFDDANENTEQWGFTEYSFNKFTNERTDYAFFTIHAFESILGKEGYSRKTFTSWAMDNGLLVHEDNRDTCRKKHNGQLKRYVGIVLKYDLDSDNEPNFD